MSKIDQVKIIGVDVADKTYKLEKLEIEEGKKSVLGAGYVSKGDRINLFIAESATVLTIDSVKDVKEDWQLILTRGVQYHRTSKISEIIDRDENSVTFRTQTSVYKLSEHYPTVEQVKEQIEKSLEELENEDNVQ